MKTLTVALVAFLGLAFAGGLPGQEKKEPAKDEVVALDVHDFPIRVGPEAVKDKDEDAKRKDAACRKKYHEKQVKFAGIVAARPAANDKEQRYTLRLTYAVMGGNQFHSVTMDIDVIPAKASPELNKQSKSGLIAEVVGRCEIDAKGRLLLKDAKVMGTSVPPG
jgi:hypothetical protein